LVKNCGLDTDNTDNAGKGDESECEKGITDFDEVYGASIRGIYFEGGDKEGLKNAEGAVDKCYKENMSLRDTFSDNELERLCDKEVGERDKWKEWQKEYNVAVADLMEGILETVPKLKNLRYSRYGGKVGDSNPLRGIKYRFWNGKDTEERFESFKENGRAAMSVALRSGVGIIPSLGWWQKNVQGNAAYYASYWTGGWYWTGRMKYVSIFAGNMAGVLTSPSGIGLLVEGRYFAKNAPKDKKRASRFFSPLYNVGVMGVVSGIEAWKSVKDSGYAPNLRAIDVVESSAAHVVADVTAVAAAELAVGLGEMGWDHEWVGRGYRSVVGAWTAWRERMAAKKEEARLKEREKEDKKKKEQEEKKKAEEEKKKDENKEKDKDKEKKKDENKDKDSDESESGSDEGESDDEEKKKEVDDDDEEIDDDDKKSETTTTTETKTTTTETIVEKEKERLKNEQLEKEKEKERLRVEQEKEEEERQLELERQRKDEKERKAKAEAEEERLKNKKEGESESGTGSEVGEDTDADANKDDLKVSKKKKKKKEKKGVEEEKERLRVEQEKEDLKKKAEEEARVKREKEKEDARKKAEDEEKERVRKENEDNLTNRRTGGGGNTNYNPDNNISGGGRGGRGGRGGGGGGGRGGGGGGGRGGGGRGGSGQQGGGRGNTNYNPYNKISGRGGSGQQGGGSGSSYSSYSSYTSYPGKSGKSE
jgi:hypothetical protein